MPRAVEELFGLIKNKTKGEYHVILSMFEIRREKIRDLLTLSPNELNRVGDFGPKVSALIFGKKMLFIIDSRHYIL